MRRFAVALLVAQAFSVCAEAVQSDAARELLGSARLWVDKKRDDLAILALQKLLRLEPDQTDALLMLGEIELRLDHRDQAEKLLQQLQAKHPGHPAGHQLSEAYRVATTGKKTMAMIRLLSRSGKDEEAANLLSQLFPDGNPGGELGEEYSRIMAAAKKALPQPPTTLAPTGIQPAKADTPSDSSRFWDLIAAANAALDAKQWPKAEKLAKSALRIYRDDPEALLALASAELEMNKAKQAERLYRRVLDLKPIEDRALRGLIRILTDGGRRAEAIAFVGGFVEKHPASMENFAQPWGGLLRDEADALLNTGETARAQSLLENGVNTLPGQVWLRYDLAGLYKRQGLSDLGRRVMAEGVKLAPNDAEMAYANAIYLSSLGDYDGVLAGLQTIPEDKYSEGMKALALKAEVRGRLNRASIDYLAGKRQAAYIELDEAERLAQDDAGLCWEVAQSWISNGETEKGLSLARRLRQINDTESTLRYAELLNQVDRDDELNGVLDAMPPSLLSSEPQRHQVRVLRRAALLRRSAELGKQRRFGEARLLLERGGDFGLADDPKWLMAKADNLEESGDYAGALDIYRRVAEKDAADYDARLGVARMQIRLQDTAGVGGELQRLDKLVPSTEIYTRLGLARQFSALGLHDDARRIAEAVGDAHLGDDGVQMQVGRIEKSAERYERALLRFENAKQIALADPADAIAPEPAQEAIDSVKQRRYGFATGGFDQRQLTGTPGISKVTNDEYPLLIRQPYGYQGHFFAQIDYSNISAGKLNLADFDTAGLFGKIQALGANKLQGLSDQTATGVDFGAGYETDDWRFDLGTSPQGFPVSYLVGGIKHTGSIGDGYYMVDVSRRPVTNSLLSYAGAYDPVTGAVWGGVRRNGAEFYSGYDIGRLGLFLQGSGYYLNGENVKSNTALMGRTGADWALINDSDMRLTAGFALMYLADGNNQQNYTYGHGGYWSPQDYKSISFPLQWTGRFHKLSYLFRGSGSYSMSKQDGADFYPTDKALQLAAYNQPLPAGYDRPVYDASSSTAFGYTLMGMLEYQVQDQWYLGARMELSRSPYYAPNFMTFYFRYDFEPSKKPIPFPPRPVKPYDRF